MCRAEGRTPSPYDGPQRACTDRERLVVLDVVRGIAVLGIFFMNVPFMGNTIFWQADPRLLGRSSMDRATFAFLDIFLDGTQRGLFQILFGASIMLLTRAIMRPDGPVEVADQYFRRYIWLFAFGLIDVFAVSWDGDILHPYAVGALFLFPFRKLRPGQLLTLGLSFALATSVLGGIKYAERTSLQKAVASAEVARERRLELTPTQSAEIEIWANLSAAAPPRTELDDERQAHANGAAATWAWLRQAWFELQRDDWFTVGWIAESIPTMLIGMALFGWGATQGGRSTRFYACLAIAGYAFGVSLRGLDLSQLMTFTPVPRIGWIAGEPARLSITVAHLALINLTLKAGFGRWLLRPFAAAGRMAFSLYFFESILGIWVLFSTTGFNLWGRFGWAGLTIISAGVAALLLLVANFWMRAFMMGPLERLWRSLI